MGSNKSILYTAMLLLLPAFVALNHASAQGSYIKVSRADADTRAVQNAVESIISSIPKALRDRVFGAGCRVVIVPSVAEYIGATYSDKPRGYTDGGGYDNADGLFIPANNELLVSERVSYRNSAPQAAARIPYVLRHEFGHAFDRYLGQQVDRGPYGRRQVIQHAQSASSLAKLLDTHQNEVKRLTNSTRTDLAYFCQAGTAGASETFAELFCLHCEPTSEWTPRQQALIRAFAGCDSLVRSIMNSPDTVGQWDAQ
jgi:hypothetical protein